MPLQVNIPIEVKPGELRCARCFSRDIAPCIPAGLRDTIMGRFARVPKICRFCGKRFYVRGQAPDRGATGL